MAAERTRPPLSGEVVSTEEVKDGDEVVAEIEVHTFDPYPFGDQPVKDDKGNVAGLKVSGPLQAAIDAKHVLLGNYKWTTKEVDGKKTKAREKVSATKNMEFAVPNPEDKDGYPLKIYRQAFTPCFATNRAGATVLPGIGGDEDELWDMVSSSVNQGTSQPIYIDLRNAGSGPEKQIKRIQKILSGMTEEQKLVALKELGLV